MLTKSQHSNMGILQRLSILQPTVRLLLSRIYAAGKGSSSIRSGMIVVLGLTCDIIDWATAGPTFPERFLTGHLIGHFVEIQTMPTLHSKQRCFQFLEGDHPWTHAQWAE